MRLLLQPPAVSTSFAWRSLQLSMNPLSGIQTGVACVINPASRPDRQLRVVRELNRFDLSYPTVAGIDGTCRIFYNASFATQEAHPAMISLASKGRQLGRFTLPAVAVFLDSKHLPADLHFWREGMQDWLPVAQLDLAESKPAKAQQPPKRIIVLGMHRSGTSCLMGFLQASGVYLGSPPPSWPPPGRKIPKALGSGAKSAKFAIPYCTRPGLTGTRSQGLTHLCSGLRCSSSSEPASKNRANQNTIFFDGASLACHWGK